MTQLATARLRQNRAMSRPVESLYRPHCGSRQSTHEAENFAPSKSTIVIESLIEIRFR
jgi:hypothetical protein